MPIPSFDPIPMPAAGTAGAWAARGDRSAARAVREPCSGLDPDHGGDGVAGTAQRQRPLPAACTHIVQYHPNRHGLGDCAGGRAVALHSGSVRPTVLHRRDSGWEGVDSSDPRPDPGLVRTVPLQIPAAVAFG